MAIGGDVDESVEERSEPGAEPSSASAFVGRDVRVGVGTRLGAGCHVGDRVVFGRGVIVGEGARIGDDVRIGEGVSIGADARLAVESDPRRPPLVIEADARVGEGAVVHVGVTIGRGARIDAESVVESSVPRGALASGRPAHVEGPHGESDDVLPGGARLVPFRQFLDGRGRLSVGEIASELPFLPKRVFIVDHVPIDTQRGGHAHLECHQFLFCAGGSCVVTVDDGISRAVVVLESSSMGLHVPPLVWAAEERFTPGTQLVVLASHAYDASDYVHDFAQFTRLLARPRE